MTLFGRRRLHAIDMQNIFCETDKYVRVDHPELKLKNSKKPEKIKQRFEITGPLPEPFIPPKWK